MSTCPEAAVPLEVRDVSFSYNGAENVLEHLSLSLNKGELVSVLGVSGCGKTTLFNVIAGLLKPQSGAVYMNGADITGQTGKVSYMLQKDLLLPYRTIEDNVALPLLIRGVGKKDSRRQAGERFAAFGLEGTQKKYPHELSGGMRQRAALLRTYLFSSEVALLDEPFSALDAITKTELHSWYLGVMREIRLSTLFITHDIDEAILLSDRIVLLGGKPGTIISEIAVAEPRENREDFALSEAFLGYKRSIKGLLKSL